MDAEVRGFKIPLWEENTMKCDRNHTDPNDKPSDMHIAACYEAYEIYWDRDGLVDEREFNEQSVENRLAEIKQFGSRPASDPIRKAVLPGYENDPDTTCLCGAPSHNDVCSVDGCVASQSHSSDTDCTVGDDNCCTVCGVEHGERCPTCGKRAYHTAGCIHNCPQF